MDITLAKETVKLLSQARLNKIPLPILPKKLRQAITALSGPYVKPIHHGGTND